MVSARLEEEQNPARRVGREEMAKRSREEINREMILPPALELTSRRRHTRRLSKRANLNAK